jgi:hypothetical protein
VRRAALRQRRAARSQASEPIPVPSPTGGWNAVDSQSNMKPDQAITLDNWFPTAKDVRVRRGYELHANGMGSGVVESLLIYNGVTVVGSKMFAATGGVIYDVSAGGAGSSSVTGLSSNRWQYANFTTSGGKFLWICNGVDAPRHFDGTTWATPSLTVTTFSASDIVNVNAHKNRLWFVFKDSTVAGYLATGAVAGTVTNFELGGLLTKGGYLVAMATWTKDGGAGEDDLAVFISSRGQVAVYAGTDPASAVTWQLVGVFDLGAPIGRRCFAKVAGDVALVNIDGVLPLSKALVTDRGAAAGVAITRNINDAMNEVARSYSGNFGWELTPYPTGTMAILNVPIEEGQTQYQFVMNTLTGAWCRFLGQNANCWAVFNDDLYFGGNDGTVNLADTGGLDGEDPIDAICQQAYNYFGSRGSFKDFKMMQPLLTTDADSRPSVGISTDYKDNVALGTPTAATASSALYDVALYDTDVYAPDSRSVADWTTVTGQGYCASIHFRFRSAPTSGVLITRWNGANMLFEPGGVL